MRALRYDTVPDPDAEVKEGEEEKTKTVPRTSNVWETVNSAKPLWMRDPKELTESECDRAVWLGGGRSVYIFRKPILGLYRSPFLQRNEAKYSFCSLC